jgi:hypothetical protein
VSGTKRFWAGGEGAFYPPRVTLTLASLPPLYHHHPPTHPLARRSYVIYSFYVLMLESLGSRATVLDELESRGGTTSVLPPL